MRPSSDAFLPLRRSMFKCLQLSVLYPEGRNPEYGPIYVPLTRYGYFRFDNTASFCLEYTNRPLTLLYVCIVARKTLFCKLRVISAKNSLGIIRCSYFDWIRCSEPSLPLPSWLETDDDAATMPFPFLVSSVAFYNGPHTSPEEQLTLLPPSAK